MTDRPSSDAAANPEHKPEPARDAEAEEALRKLRHEAGMKFLRRLAR